MSENFPIFGNKVLPLSDAAKMTVFDSFGGLLDAGADFVNASDKDANYFFRGECAVFPNPTPGLFRNQNYLRNEDKIFQYAQNHVPALFANCPTTYDKLCQMQHYGFPTRLIDISTDLAMAWFMAVDGWIVDDVFSANNNPNGFFFVPSVLVLRVPREREKFLGSDLVSALSSVARMKCRFNSGHLSYETKQERHGFDEHFLLRRMREDFSHNYAVYPRMSNPRLVRQKGAFILCGLTQENCARLACGNGTEADKMKADPQTGLHYPKIEWDLSKSSKEISICGRFLPSRKYFKEVSDALSLKTQTYSDYTRVSDAVKKFKEKVFKELSLVGGGESDAYADDFTRQSAVCRRFFEKY